MDIVDKSILLELATNCRVTYQTIATRLDLTVNAVKKRILKLEEEGVIQRYYVYLSLAMMDAEWFLARITLSDTHFSPEFLDRIGAHPSVFSAGYLSDGSILVFAEYIGAQGLSELGGFLRQLPGVANVEIHTLIADRGQKIPMTDGHLKVLRSLREDARMPISQISEQTGLTPRRIRSVIQDFHGKVGTPIETLVDKEYKPEISQSKAALHFRIYWDLNAGGGNAFVVRTNWEEGKGSPEGVVQYFKSHFPFEFWFSFVAATEPIIYCVFIVNHIRESEKILPVIRKAPNISKVEIWVSFPLRKYVGLRESMIDEMIAHANL
ncbi:MAG: winged helix-turn-helix transcriptional regulator [Promethearchaeota archaeon]